MHAYINNVVSIAITDDKGLPPIRVYIASKEKGHGCITITCWDTAMTAFWSGMGDRTVAQFINTCDVDYLLGCLCASCPAERRDYEAISQMIKCPVDNENIMAHVSELDEAYGIDWFFNLPQQPNPEYVHRARIVQAVMDTLTEIEAEA